MSDFCDTPTGRLLLAAPDLVEALEGWLHDYTTLTAYEWSNRYRTFRDRVHQTAAAIEKAKNAMNDLKNETGKDIEAFMQSKGEPQ